MKSPAIWKYLIVKFVQNNQDINWVENKSAADQSALQGQKQNDLSDVHSLL
jgi:hypothetical protein